MSRTVSGCFSVFRQLRTIKRSVPTDVFIHLVVTLFWLRLDFGCSNFCLKLGCFLKIKVVVSEPRAKTHKPSDVMQLDHYFQGVCELQFHDKKINVQPR
jgi:hypothetical protein